MVKVLFLTRYGSRGASTRYRTLQYVPYFEQEGFQTTISSMFSDKYLERLYVGGRKNKWEVIKGYTKRIHTLMGRKKFDLVFLEKEALPYMPSSIERILLDKGLPLVLDFDDAIFHRYDQSENRLVRALLKNKIRHVMKYADCVIVGNEYLADYARKSGSKRVEVVPTVVDLQKYPTKQLASPSQVRPFTVGWIGSPTTAKFLDLVEKPLKRLEEDAPVKLLAVGSGPLDGGGVPTEVRKWSSDRELDDLRSMSVGVMPLPDNPWERGKCGFKLIQYMAAGLPVVASPVGVNNDIVQDGKNGYLARTDEDWVRSLQSLREDQALLDRMGRTGRRMVEEKYSLQATSPRMVSILKSVLNGGAR